MPIQAQVVDSKHSMDVHPRSLVYARSSMVWCQICNVWKFMSKASRPNMPIHVDAIKNVMNFFIDFMHVLKPFI